MDWIRGVGGWNPVYPNSVKTCLEKVRFDMPKTSGTPCLRRGKSDFTERCIIHEYSFLMLDFPT